MSRTLPAWIELSRPGNVLMGAATCILGGFMVGMGPETYLAVTLGGLSVALFMMAGNIVNDIVDSDIDAKAHPYRPIPSGRISKMLAKRLAIVAWTLIPIVGKFAFGWRIILTTGTGSIFGFLVAREAYSTAVLAPLFIVMSLLYGTAVFYLLLKVISKFGI